MCGGKPKAPFARLDEEKCQYSARGSQLVAPEWPPAGRWSPGLVWGGMVEVLTGASIGELIGLGGCTLH